MTIKEQIRFLANQKGTGGIPVLESELGFGSSTISKWDKSAPSIDKLIKVANYFDVSLDYLVGREQRFSDEAIEINTEIAINGELREMLAKFMKLDVKKQAHVSELISLLSE